MTEIRTFCDTNILVYAYDASAGKKHEVAGGLVADLWNSGAAVISTQVLEEFFVTVTRKLPKPLKAETAAEIVRDLLQWSLIVIDGQAILDAIEIQTRHRLSFWDALIVQSALTGGAQLLLSEDMGSGQVIEGLRIKNPFK